MAQLAKRLAAIEKARAAPTNISITKVGETTTRELLAVVLGGPLTEDQAGCLFRDPLCRDVLAHLLGTLDSPTQHVLARRRALDWARQVIRGAMS